MSRLTGLTRCQKHFLLQKSNYVAIGLARLADIPSSAYRASPGNRDGFSYACAVGYPTLRDGARWRTAAINESPINKMSHQGLRGVERW